MLMKKIQYLLLLTLLFIVISMQNAYSQYATVRGFVYEKETGEAVIFTNVYLYKTTYGAATDVNGYFAISKVPPGKYTLMVTYLGFDTLKMDITLQANEILTKKLYLKKGAYTLDQVQVSASRQEARTETNTSVVKITPKQIKQLPSVGGQPDFAQYLQVVPGVIFTGDQGGQLYIRGGTPIQNKVLLDGMTIYNPFHSIGLFSVFDTEILRNADVYTGGFGAEYGGRISSVMDITTRSGNKTRFAGKVGASTFGANVLIEGPISKQKEGKGGSSSFLFSAKNSYLEQSSKVFYEYANEDGLPFNYTDLYGKISLSGANGSNINLFGFNFNDKVTQYRALADYNWKSYGGGMNFLVIPGKSPVLIEGYLAYSSYKISLEETNKPARTSSINGFNLGFDFSYFIGKDAIKYGIELSGFKTDYFFFNSIGTKINYTQNTTEIGAFVKYKKTAGKWLIEPSLRFQWYASLSEGSLEPRLALKYNVNDIFRLKFAGGLYSQNLIAATSDRDVVNLFYGFLSGPESLPKTFDGKEVTSKLQKSQHLILGVEYDVSRFLTVNIEGYFKNFPQLTNINRQKLFDENAFPDAEDILVKDFIIENGYSTGVDFSLKYDQKRLYIWAVYSLGFVTRRYEQLDGSLAEYRPNFDRRHNVNLIFTYILGSKYDWEVNARWNYGSGFPFTLTQGFYPQNTFPNGIYTDYTTTNEDLGILYGDLNTGQLPSYYRLDIGAKKTFNFSAHSKLEILASVTNLFNTDNLFYIDRVSGEKIYQLPIMPSMGVSFYF
jgi:hypothetical protein